MDRSSDVQERVWDLRVASILHFRGKLKMEKEYTYFCFCFWSTIHTYLVFVAGALINYVALCTFGHEHLLSGVCLWGCIHGKKFYYQIMLTSVPAAGFASTTFLLPTRFGSILAPTNLSRFTVDSLILTW